MELRRVLLTDRSLMCIDPCVTCTYIASRYYDRVRKQSTYYRVHWQWVENSHLRIDSKETLAKRAEHSTAVSIMVFIEKKASSRMYFSSVDKELAWVFGWAKLC